MAPETLFEIANPLALLGWICLVLWPLARRPLMLVAGYALPLILSLGYTSCILAFWGTAEGGYDSLANVMLLFASPGAALAGWIHYLAFDLAIGGWIVRDAHKHGIPHLATLPSLVLTFLFGPLGLLLHAAARGVVALRTTTSPERI